MRQLYAARDAQHPRSGPRTPRPGAPAVPLHRQSEVHRLVHRFGSNLCTRSPPCFRRSEHMHTAPRTLGCTGAQVFAYFHPSACVCACSRLSSARLTRKTCAPVHPRSTWPLTCADRVHRSVRQPVQTCAPCSPSRVLTGCATQAEAVPDPLTLLLGACEPVGVALALQRLAERDLAAPVLVGHTALAAPGGVGVPDVALGVAAVLGAGLAFL